MYITIIHPYSNGKLRKNIIADTAMYAAKELEKNTYKFFGFGMKEKSLRKIDIENRLKYALENKKFIIHYRRKYILKVDQ
ncbi:hypothetical protein [Peptoclostridium litorale]|nr:hypothetical protein [Peptoclostridium litorale]